MRHTKRKSKRPRERANEPNLGEVIRRRRRELNLTQAELASKIKISQPYMGHLESGMRHPSNLIVTRLAKVLRLNKRELFFVANPHKEAFFSAQSQRAKESLSAWDQFQKDKQLLRIYNVSNDEMEMLSHVVRLGQIHSPYDLIYILNTVRHALKR